MLTSRSGVATLDKAGDWVGQRISHYLRNREDLTFRTAALDATSAEGLKNLLGELEYPVGGCLLLAALLNDRTFASQTKESFESTFAPKIQGFQVLEQTLDLGALDFVVAFSSISGMFGSPGQTNYAA